MKSRGDFLNFQARMLGEGGAKNQPKKYNIDYFGQAVNLEFKFKLNFDKEGVSKIEKKNFKKNRVKQEIMEVHLNQYTC